MRKAALYNIKALNTGFGDYFGKSRLKEKQLENERQKLAIVLSKVDNIKDAEDILYKPGMKRR